MNKTNSFEQFLTTQSAQIPLAAFVVDLLLAALLSWVLARMYTRFGTSLSNRRNFARNFVLLTTTTMLIITIVKSSLALSLGLVGALSIVRFRAAIKEPEELMYLFLSIGIGLGLGAGQREITLVGFTLIGGLTWLNSRQRSKEEGQSLHVTITSRRGVQLEQILATAKKYCDAVSLGRFDESDSELEACLTVQFADVHKLSQCKEELRGLDNSMVISFLDSQAV